MSADTNSKAAKNIFFKDIAPKVHLKQKESGSSGSTNTGSLSSKANNNLNNLMFLNSVKVSYPVHTISKEILRFIPDSQLDLIKPIVDDDNDGSKDDKDNFIQKKKYSTNVDERNFLTVFEYKLNDNWIIWDYSTGYVFFTGLWKSCGNNKTDIVKLVENFPNLSNVVKRVRGGFLKIQGTWLPFDVVKNLAKNFCFNIRYCLIPIFGENFPNECLLPSDKNFGKLIDLNSKIQVENAALGHRRRRSTTSANTQSSNMSHLLPTPSSIGKPHFKKRSKSDVQYQTPATSKIQLLELEEILKASKSLHDLSSSSTTTTSTTSSSNLKSSPNYFFSRPNLSSTNSSTSFNSSINYSNFQYGGFIWSWNDQNNLMIIGKESNDEAIDDSTYPQSQYPQNPHYAQPYQQYKYPQQQYIIPQHQITKQPQPHTQPQPIQQHSPQQFNKGNDPSIPKNYDGVDTILNAAHQLMNFHSGSNNSNDVNVKRGKMDIDGLLS